MNPSQMFSARPPAKFPLAVLFVGLLIQGCATGSKVPQIRPEELPAAAFKALSPRTVQVEVKVDRPVNQKAGNSAEVERAVLTAVEAALTRGGLAVNSGSPNRFSIVVEDYAGKGMDKEMSEGTGECVTIIGKLRAKWGSSFSAQGDACHYIQRENGFAMAGDVSDSYTLGLKLVLDLLEKHQMDLLRGGK